MDDSKIIELFFERSEQAIIELSNKYGTICSKIADNILNNRLDSEECVNDAYLGVWNTIPPQRPNPLLSYVCRIDCIPSSFSVEDEIMAKEVASVIDDFLETLDQQSRIMFIRRYWHADSIEEIATLFHKSKHYISVRLSRIRKALRQHLRKKGVFL